MQNLLSNLKITINEKLYVKDPETSELGRNILKNSIILIDEIGFEAFTFKKLGEKIQSNESSIYRYFENKHKLLVYLTSWYWSWMEYRMVFATTNVSNPIEKLEKAIKLVTENVTDDHATPHINEEILSQIIVEEFTKTLMTKEVDNENKDGFFLVYKRVVNRIIDIIKEVNPDYPYAKSLASSIVEGALHQHFLKNHLKTITNLSEKECATEFYTDMAKKNTTMTPLKRFKNLILIDKQDIYQIFLYSIIAGLISLSLPLGIQSIINFIQAGKVSTSWIVLVIIVVVGVAFVGLLKIMQFRITENLQQKIFVRSSFEFAYRFPKIKFNELHNQYPPELANRFFDTLTVQKGFSKLLLDISGAALQILFGIILLSLYHSFFIFFGLVLLILLYLIYKINFNIGLETSLKESKYKYKIAHWLQEIARNHLSFKSNSIFNYSLHKNDKLVNEYLKQRESHFQVLMKQFIQLTGFKILITAGLLIIGGLLVINQQMNIGQFVAAEIIILSIIAAVEKLFSGLELFYDVLTSLEKLGSVVDMELEEDFQNSNYLVDKNKITIETENVSFSYPKSDKEILKNINLSIEPKQHTLILGENGSGKTTLVRLLARLIEPSSGSIFINNTNYKKYSSDEYRSKIGIITANEMPFEGTILENITCNNPEIKMETVFDLIEKLKLTEAIKSLPKGLDTQISSEGKQINSSTIQKIVLARCIINQPKLLFLENPLDKSDEQSCREILDFLSDEKHPWTLIVVSKNSYWKQICKQTILLEKGEIKAN